MLGYLRHLTNQLGPVFALWVLAAGLCLFGLRLLSAGSDTHLQQRIAIAAEVVSAELADDLVRSKEPEVLPKVKALLVRQDIGFAWLRVRNLQGYAVAAAGRLESSGVGAWGSSGLQRQIYSLISTDHQVRLLQDGEMVGSLEFGLLIGSGNLRAAGGRVALGLLALLVGIPLLLFLSWRIRTLLLRGTKAGKHAPIDPGRKFSAVRPARKLLSESGELITVFDRGALVVSPDHRVVDINSRATDLTGWTQQEARDQPLAEVLHLIAMDSMTRVQLPIERIFSGAEERLHERYSLSLRHGGARRDVFIDVGPVRDSTGHIGAVLVSLSAVDQRTEALKRVVPAAALSAQPDPKQLSQLLLDQILDCVITTDSQDRIRFANDRALENFGYSLTEIRGQHISKLIPEPFLRHSQMRIGDLALALPDAALPQAIARRRDGSQYKASLVVNPVQLKGRQGHVLTVRQVAQVREAGDISTQLRRMIDNTRESVLVIDPDDLRVVTGNERAIDRLGFNAKEISGKPLPKLSPQLSLEGLRSQVEKLREGSVERIETRLSLHRADGSRYQAESCLSLWYGDTEPMLLLVLRDYNEAVELPEATEKGLHPTADARHDALTGLPNRGLFAERLQECAASSDVNGRPFMVIHMGLPEFSGISQRMGHGIADALLKAMADRLSSTVRSEDTVSRLGGSDFSLLMTGLDRRKDASDVLRRIQVALSRPLRANGQDIQIKACLGSAVYPDDAKTVAQLLRHAGLALHQARLQGPGHACQYQPHFASTRETVQDPDELLSEAQQRGELAVELQLVSDVKSRRVVGAELLLAWEYPNQGLLRTTEQVLKASGNEALAGRMGLWALHQACIQLANWRDLELPGLPLIVNLMALPLAGRRDAQAVRSLLAENRVKPERIIVLVSAAELERLVFQENDWLPVLRDLGLRLGVKELEPVRGDLLRQADIDLVQLTPDSIAGLPGSKEMTERVSLIIEAAQKVGAHVLASGVERAEQCEALKVLGCRYQQGRLLGEPQSPVVLARNLTLAEIGTI